MYIEPGRFLVGNAEVLLTRVNTIKESYRKFAGVDCGFGTLLRPTMYGSYHHIVVANKINEENVEEKGVWSRSFGSCVVSDSAFAALAENASGRRSWTLGKCVRSCR